MVTRRLTLMLVPGCGPSTKCSSHKSQTLSSKSFWCLLFGNSMKPRICFNVWWKYQSWTRFLTVATLAPWRSQFRARSFSGLSKKIPLSSTAISNFKACRRLREPLWLVFKDLRTTLPSQAISITSADGIWAKIRFLHTATGKRMNVI